jgi:hypothetical protein
MKNKPHNRICRGAHYHALAEGYAMLNFRMANSFHRAADLYDHTDPPLDLATETVDWAGEDLRREGDLFLRDARNSPRISVVPCSMTLRSVVSSRCWSAASGVI